MTVVTHPDETLDIIHIPDHKARSISVLLDQYRTKPRMRDWIMAQGEAFQILEDELFDLHYGSLLENAADDALDQWGVLVGEERGPLGNNDYRRFIDARILANITECFTDELYEIFRLITYPSTVLIWDVLPMCFQLTAFRNEPMTDQMVRRVVNFMADVKPAGIAMILVEALWGYEGYLENPEAEPIDRGSLARVLE